MINKECHEAGLEPPEKAVGQFFREKRLAVGLTQANVARALGYTTAQFVSNWERGTAVPPINALPALVRTLTIPASEVVEVMTRYQTERYRMTLAEVLRPGASAPEHQSS